MPTAALYTAVTSLSSCLCRLGRAVGEAGRASRSVGCFWCGPGLVLEGVSTAWGAASVSGSSTMGAHRLAAGARGMGIRVGGGARWWVSLGCSPWWCRGASQRSLHSMACCANCACCACWCVRVGTCATAHTCIVASPHYICALGVMLSCTVPFNSVRMGCKSAAWVRSHVWRARAMYPGLVLRWVGLVTRLIRGSATDARRPGRLCIRSTSHIHYDSPVLSRYVEMLAEVSG